MIIIVPDRDEDARHPKEVLRELTQDVVIEFKGHKYVRQSTYARLEGKSLLND